MTNGPRMTVIWCTSHHKNVATGDDWLLYHMPGGTEACDGTEFFECTEQKIDRDTALAEMARVPVRAPGDTP